MKILVTGGAGFIGMNLIKRLVSQGHHVVSLDDYSTGTQNNQIDGVKYLDADIETIEYLTGDYDLCYHIAAVSRVQPSFKDPTETFRVNVNGTRAVCEWARHNNVKVVYAGSSSKHHDPTDSPYAMYKYLGEEVCKLYKKSYDIDVRIARFYNVYGPNESLDIIDGNVIGIWRGLITKYTGEKSRILKIVGDGEQRRDFIHVNDVVEANLIAAFTDKISFLGEVYNIGYGKSYSVNQIAEWIGGDTKNIEPRIEPRETLLNSDKFKKTFGWETTIDLKKWLEEKNV